MKYLIPFIVVISGCAKARYIQANQQSPRVGLEAQNNLHCEGHFENSGLCVDIQWKTLPTETEFGAFILKIWRPNLGDGSPVPLDPAGVLNLFLYMPSMGHPSTPVTLSRVDVGTYTVDKVFFTMAGYWQIRIETKTADRVSDKVYVPFTF